MKRILLSGMLVAASIAGSFAQGYSSTGIYDDFATPTEYGDANGGLYWWSDPDGTGDAENSAITHTRDNVNGEVDVIVNQNEGDYGPFGVGFGDDGGTPATVHTIDLSGDATFSATITNNSSYDLLFRMAIVDDNDERVDTYAGTPLATPFAGTIEVQVAASSSATLSGDFTDGYMGYAANGSVAMTQNLDFTSVASVQFTVINQANTGDPAYAPLAISAADISISEVTVGDFVTGSPDLNTSVNASVSPNPTSESSVVSYPAQTGEVTVSVSDLVGNEVASVSGSATSASIDASGLASGLYIVTVLVDGTAVSAKRLVVE